MTKNLNNIPIMELSFNRTFKMSERPKIKGSNDVYQIIMNNWNHNTIDFIEEFKVIYFNRYGVVLGLLPIASGGINGVHNHPSGNVTPSQSDIQMTNQIVKEAAIFNIAVLDHLIVTSDGYFSFKEHQLIGLKSKNCVHQILPS